MESVGARVERLRRRHGWTLQDLSARSALFQSHLSNIENDKRRDMGIHTLMRLAHALNVSSDFVLGLRIQPGTHRCTGACPLFGMIEAVNEDKAEKKRPAAVVKSGS